MLAKSCCVVSQESAKACSYINQELDRAVQGVTQQGAEWHRAAQRASLKVTHITTSSDESQCFNLTVPDKWAQYEHGSSLDVMRCDINC